MLHKTSEGFRAFFLLQFTKELIKTSKGNEFVEIKKEIKKESGKEKIKKQIQTRLKEEEEETLKTAKSTPLQNKKIPQKFPPLKQKMVLKKPQTLPPKKIKNIPTILPQEIDLGKLNPLLKDPLIKIIECDGANKQIVVKSATDQTKTTDISLTEDEINKIIETFSRKANVPIKEGVFRVVYEKLILSAIISEMIGSKFIIKKMIFPKLP